jgi:hypothetical protein
MVSQVLLMPEIMHCAKPEVGMGVKNIDIKTIFVSVRRKQM